MIIAMIDPDTRIVAVRIRSEGDAQLPDDGRIFCDCGEDGSEGPQVGEVWLGPTYSLEEAAPSQGREAGASKGRVEYPEVKSPPALTTKSLPTLDIIRKLRAMDPDKLKSALANMDELDKAEFTSARSIKLNDPLVISLLNDCEVTAIDLLKGASASVSGSTDAEKIEA